jgi:hypothetical protein
MRECSSWLISFSLASRVISTCMPSMSSIKASEVGNPERGLEGEDTALTDVSGDMFGDD